MGQHIKHSDDTEGWNTGRCVSMECLRGYARLREQDAVTSERLRIQCHIPERLPLPRCPLCGAKRLVDGDPANRCLSCIRKRRSPVACGSRRARLG